MKTVLLTILSILIIGNSSFGEIIIWPRTLTNNGSVLTMYQPQVDSWQDYRNLSYRLAFSILPSQGKEILGVLYMSAKTEVEKEANTVFISDMVITKIHFPYEDDATKKNMESLVRAFLDPDHTLTMSLNQVVACTPKEPTTSNIVVNNDPPIIFHSTSPAFLLQLIGQPVKAATGKPNLEFVVNANFPVFIDANSNYYYLYDGLEWQTAPSVSGPWTFTGKIPNSIIELSTDSAWVNIRGSVPAKTKPAANFPKIFYSDKLAELILFEGKPLYTAINGTTLKFANNTNSDLFFCSANSQYYYLSAGRWFSSSSLNGPWVYATPNLPSDFLKIPDNNPASSILPFVPGTDQAADAVMIAQIPTKVQIPPDAAENIDVTYSGTPEFEPIETTELSYAVNTSSKVIKVSELHYFMCEKGIWFESFTPIGPWRIALLVPPSIYLIPPTSPVYNVTYVTQTQTSSGTVESSYTSGYEGVYVVSTSTTVVIISGTGFYYPPYYHYPPYGYPVYYPYPYTYGCYAYHAYPYGGVSYHASYNPNTGTYARGATAYGPYGSVTGVQAYNPSTGTVARGASVSTPYGTTSVAQAYNPYTGAHASTRQTSNAYGNYGSTTRTNASGKTTNTAHQTTSQGTVAAGSNSYGGKAVAGSGQNNSGAAVKTASGDKYAAVNGNVYSNTGDGWQQGVSGNSQTNTQSPSSSQTPSSTQSPTKSQSGTNSQAKAESQTKSQAPSQTKSQSPSQTQPQSKSSAPSGASSSGKYSSESQGFNSQEMNKAASDRQRGNTQTQQYQGRQSGGSGGGRPSGGGGSRGR